MIGPGRWAKIARRVRGGGSLGIGIGTLLLTLGVTLGAAGEADDSAAIRQLLSRFDAAQASEDLEALTGLIANDSDVVFFGPDLADRWVGFKAIRTGLAADFKRITSLKIEAQPARVHVRGDVAWFERLLVMNLVIREGETSLFARSTGVLERRGGRWLFVQVHTSVAAPRDSAPLE